MENEIHELYCKIYVDAENDGEWMAKTVATIMNGKLCLRTVESSTTEVDVLKNEDFDSAQAKIEGGFVFFPFYLDVVPGVGVKARKEFISAVSSLLFSFKVSYRNQQVKRRVVMGIPQLRRTTISEIVDTEGYPQ